MTSISASLPRSQMTSSTFSSGSLNLEMKSARFLQDLTRSSEFWIGREKARCEMLSKTFTNGAKEWAMEAHAAASPANSSLAHPWALCCTRQTLDERPLTFKQNISLLNPPRTQCSFCLVSRPLKRYNNYIYAIAHVHDVSSWVKIYHVRCQVD